jgi:hypothetical protein
MRPPTARTPYPASLPYSADVPAPPCGGLSLSCNCFHPADPAQCRVSRLPAVEGTGSEVAARSVAPE